MNLNVDINMLRDMLTGDEAYERREIAKFLYRLVEQLKVVLDNLDEENLTTEMTGEWESRGERLTGAENALAPFTASGMRGGRTAPSGATSLDQFTVSGIYWVYSVTYPSGWPSGESGYAVLNVFHDGGGARVQELTMYDGNGRNRRYCRMYINSQWYPWQKIATGAGVPWGLDMGTQLATGTDLDTLRTPMNYASPGNVTPTLVHAPPVASSAFILKVMAGHLANTWVQMAIDVTGAAIFIRYYNTSSWGSWYKYTGTAV